MNPYTNTEVLILCYYINVYSSSCCRGIRDVKNEVTNTKMVASSPGLGGAASGWGGGALPCSGSPPSIA